MNIGQDYNQTWTCDIRGQFKNSKTKHPETCCSIYFYLYDVQCLRPSVNKWVSVRWLMGGNCEFRVDRGGPRSPKFENYCFTPLKEQQWGTVTEWIEGLACKESLKGTVAKTSRLLLSIYPVSARLIRYLRARIRDTSYIVPSLSSGY